MLTTIQPKEYDIFVGIDTSKKSYAITHMDQNQNKHSIKSPADPAAVYNYFQKRFPDKRLLYVYEAGCTGYGLHDFLTSHGQNCIIVHPAAVKKAPNDRVKNDRIDSQKLSEQALGGQLRGIRVPDEAFRKLRHLATTRQAYAQDGRRAKQRIKSLLLFESIQLPQEIESGKHWTKRYRDSLKFILIQNETVRFRLNVLLEDLEHAQKRLLLVHRELRAFCQNEQSLRKNLGVLRSIPGFGFVVSTYILSRIGDPQNLRNVRELGSFAGVVPSEHSTGGKIQKGPITHMGDTELRRLLVQAAWIAIRKDRELEQFYNRIKTRNPKNIGPQIAIVAVARKLTARAHKVLKEQRAYIVR
jgi:transposase